MRACHDCGHEHPVMSSASRGSDIRYYCHEDDHSCYADRNGVSFTDVLDALTTKPTMADMIVAELEDVILLRYGITSSTSTYQEMGKGIAAMLAAAGYGDTTAARAGALREAADALCSGPTSDSSTEWAMSDAADWLRDRANQIEEQTNE